MQRIYAVEKVVYGQSVGRSACIVDFQFVD